MKYYAHVDDNGLILGWYCKEIHSEIPTPNITTSEEDWENALAINATHYNKKAKKFVSFTPPVTQEELISEAEYKKVELLSLATGKIEPLQDAVDLDIATESEISQLKEWKKYRVLVNRVYTLLAPDIEWPEQPQ